MGLRWLRFSRSTLPVAEFRPARFPPPYTPSASGIGDRHETPSRDLTGGRNHTWRQYSRLLWLSWSHFVNRLSDSLVEWAQSGAAGHSLVQSGLDLPGPLTGSSRSLGSQARLPILRTSSVAHPRKTPRLRSAPSVGFDSFVRHATASHVRERTVASALRRPPWRGLQGGSNRRVPRRGKGDFTSGLRPPVKSPRETTMSSHR